MKRLFLFFVLFSACFSACEKAEDTPITSQPTGGSPTIMQIGNSGFENWTLANGKVQPDSFYWMNSTFSGDTLVKKTLDKHSGEYAVVISAIKTTGSEAYGSLHYGYMQPDSFGGSHSAQWYYTSRPSKLNFWYKFERQGNDIAFVSINILKNNNAGDSSLIIGSGNLELSDDMSSYTLGQIPVTYFSNDIPNAIYIEFAANKGFGSTLTNGTTLYIDDISLE